MNTTRWSRATVCVALAAFAAPAIAGPTNVEPRGAVASVDGDEDEIKRLDKWPEPRDDRQLKVDVARLRKANTEEMGTQAHHGLVAEGAAAAPALLNALGKEKGEDARERILDVLDEITGAPHTRLLAKEFGDKSDVVRIWCLQRVAAFPDPGVREAASQALARAENAAEKGKSSEEELFAAALCATSAGDLAGLPRLAKRAEEDWKDSGAAIRTALESVRGKDATAAYRELLQSDKRPVIVAGLHLLAGCGDRETAVPLVAPFLDNTDNTLRVAAINALRGIVDGEPPLDKLPVFEAIELAGEWKKRI